ncbi:twin-arginine translocation pathway signal [Trinickia sp. EG282A]|uniref:alginate O-acetyltransferase AlgX-related protein n=1 Tax=Trinickia sp. EG282A TaxID=3237013 RepID=UPI0034D24646
MQTNPTLDMKSTTIRQPGTLDTAHDARRRRLLLAFAALPLASLPFVPRTARAAQQAVIEGRDRWLFPGWESFVEDETAACLRIVDLIGKVADKMTARGIHCTTVIAPLKARASADKLADGQAVSDAVMKRYAALFAHAAEIKLDMVDGEAALKAVDTSADNTYIRADYHWSAHTSEAFADATAERLRASKVLDGAHGDGTPLGDWTEEVNYGDLANLLPPERKRAIGKDRFIVRQEQAEGGLLAGAAPIVHVVGNSMVQPYLGFPQKLSNVLELPVGLTWTFGDTGPWKTLVDYLESADFKQNTPKAIVWQFNEGQMMFGPGATGQWDPKSIQPDGDWLARVEKALA